MKQVAAIMMLAAGIAAPVYAQTQAQQETLADAIASAFESNPSLMAQRSVRLDADEALIQARSTLFPTLSAQGTYAFRESKVGEKFSPTFPRDGSSNLSTAGLEARQSLYAGGANSARRRAAKAGVDLSEAQLSSFEQQLTFEVIGAYLDVRRAEEALSIRGANVDALRQQVQAAQDRFDVGEVTRTDIAQAQARAAGAEAALAAAQSDLASTRAAYESIVGRPAVQLAPPPAIPPLPGALNDAIALGLSANPELAAARAAELSAEEVARAVRGDKRPRLDLVGRTGWQDTRWDRSFQDTNSSITAELSIPLFRGGELRSRTRSAELQADRARFERMAAERGVTEQVTSAWHAVTASRHAIEASQSHVEAAEVALEGIRQEQSLGERITLDVLDQEQELLLARLALVDAERSAYLAAHQLLAAIGQLGPERQAR